jgi:hypothetical protein
MKIPYDKNIRLIFGIFGGSTFILLISCFFLFPNDSEEWIFAAIFFALLIYWIVCFVYTYRWYEIDSDGIKVHNILGKTTAHKWSEFAYVGPTVLVSSQCIHYKMLVCTQTFPRKKFRNSESFVIPKHSLQFPCRDEIRGALQAYCPDFSTDCEKP